LHKGPNLTGLDPDTGELTRLFNPRLDQWVEHFVRDGVAIIPRTAIGRTTVWVLQLNADEMQRLRARFRP
jgi:hypothetical protein